MNRNQVNARRHYLLEIFQYLGPGERLALDQLVEELGLVAGRAILRLVQECLRLLALAVTLRDLSAVGRDGGMVVPGRHPVRNGVGQQSQSHNHGHGQSRPPTQPELPRIFIGLAREIDVETHESQWSVVSGQWSVVS